MKTLITTLLRLGIALFAAGGIAHAQGTAPPPAGDAEEEPRRYTIEMIIFEYAEEDGLGSEIFVPDPVEPEPGVGEVHSLEPAAANRGDMAERRAGLDLGIRTLPRGELTMNEILARLERLDAYRPLMHFGWTQTTVGADLSPELPLARFGTPPQGLDGNLKLYLNRFLHLVVDVSKLAPDSGAPVRRPRPAIDESVDGFDAATERDTPDRGIDVREYEPLRYRIREDRIMKNGETRYYDHPKFGIIAKVTRVDEPDSSASAGF